MNKGTPIAIIAITGSIPNDVIRQYLKMNHNHNMLHHMYHSYSYDRNYNVRIHKVQMSLLISNLLHTLQPYLGELFTISITSNSCPRSHFNTPHWVCMYLSLFILYIRASNLISTIMTSTMTCL